MTHDHDWQRKVLCFRGIVPQTTAHHFDCEGPVYRCEAASVEGFIQQLAVSYVAKGYWFYVTGQIPAHKTPQRVDQKLIERYGLEVSKYARARRKRAGLANVQYLRLGPVYVLLATPGEHPFFAAEGRCIRDLRRVPLKVFGYAVSYRVNRGQGHASVRIERARYHALKAHFMALALQRSVDQLAVELREVPFVPYAPVKRQLLMVVNAVNRVRRVAGFEPVPLAALKLRRSPVKPFGDRAGSGVV